jgi:hypothetical protein
VQEVKGRKVIVESIISAGGKICARAEVVADQMPQHLITGALLKPGKTPAPQ